MIDMEIVAFTFENAHKHINALRRQKKRIILSVKTSRMYNNCQGVQRKLSFPNIILSNMK